MKCDNVMEDDQRSCIASGSCHCLDYARAAIAAVREYEGAATHSKTEYVRESERAACEAIARRVVDEKDWTTDERLGAWHIAAAIAARKGKGEGK
jgi:hypothetical protein